MQTYICYPTTNLALWPVPFTSLEQEIIIDSAIKVILKQIPSLAWNDGIILNTSIYLYDLEDGPKGPFCPVITIDHLYNDVEKNCNIICGNSRKKEKQAGKIVHLSFNNQIVMLNGRIFGYIAEVTEKKLDNELIISLDASRLARPNSIIAANTNKEDNCIFCGPGSELPNERLGEPIVLKIPHGPSIATNIQFSIIVILY